MMINDLIKALTEYKEKYGNVSVFAKSSTSSREVILGFMHKQVQESTNVVEFKRKEKRK